MRKIIFRHIALALAVIIPLQDAVWAVPGTGSHVSCGLQAQLKFVKSDVMGQAEVALGYVLRKTPSVEEMSVPVTVELDGGVRAVFDFSRKKPFLVGDNQAWSIPSRAEDAAGNPLLEFFTGALPGGGAVSGIDEAELELRSARLSEPRRTEARIEKIDFKPVLEPPASKFTGVKHSAVNAPQLPNPPRKKIRKFPYGIFKAAALGSLAVLLAVNFNEIYEFFSSVIISRLSMRGYILVGVVTTLWAVIAGAALRKSIRRFFIMRFAVKDVDTLAGYIAKLEGGKFGSHGARKAVGGAEVYSAYDKRYLRPLFELLFLRLKEDFSGTAGFIKYCRRILRQYDAYELRTRMGRRTESGGEPVWGKDADLWKEFRKIRFSRRKPSGSLGLYGVLLFYLTLNPRDYLDSLYDEYMKDNPPEDISLGQKGVSYHNQGNSIVHFYDKGILLEGRRPFYRDSIQYGFSEKPVKTLDRTENADKVRKAVEIWKKQALQPGREYLQRRIMEFIESTTVVELTDMKTFMLFSDPDQNIVRPVHAGRSRRVIYIPKPYLDGLSAESDMQELAMWLNFGQKFLMLQDELIKQGKSEAYVQRARTSMNFLFFANEDSGLVDHQALKLRMSAFMKQDTICKYTELLSETFKQQKQVQNDFTEGKHFGDKVKLAEARNVFGKHLFKYEALGMHARALQAYADMREATRELHVADEGILPYTSRRMLVLTALRFGLWDEFIRELRLLLTGKGYRRKMKYSEMEHVIRFADRKGAGEKSFETDINNAISSHLQAAGSRKEADKIRDAAKKARLLLDGFLAYPFKDLGRGDIADDRPYRRDAPVGIDEVLDFCNEHAIKTPDENENGAVHGRLRPTEIIDCFDTIADAMGGRKALAGKLIMDADSRDLTAPLVVSNIYGASVRAVEEDPIMFKGAQANYNAAGREGIADKVYLGQNSSSAFDLPWGPFDCVFIPDVEKCRENRINYVSECRMKALEIRSGSVLAAVFTAEQLKQNSDRIPHWRSLHREPIDISQGAGRFFLRIYRPAVRNSWIYMMKIFIGKTASTLRDIRIQKMIVSAVLLKTFMDRSGVSGFWKACLVSAVPSLAVLCMAWIGKDHGKGPQDDGKRDSPGRPEKSENTESADVKKDKDGGIRELAEKGDARILSLSLVRGNNMDLGSLEGAVRRARDNGFNAVLLADFLENVPAAASVSDAPAAVFSPYAVNPAAIDWQKSGISGDTPAERWAAFSKSPPDDFGFFKNRKIVKQYALVKARYILKNNVPGYSGDKNVPGPAVIDLVADIVSMEQYVAVGQLKGAVKEAHRLGLYLGCELPFFRAIEGTDAFFQKRIFEIHGGKIAPAGLNIGMYSQVLWGDEAAQSGVARYDWGALAESGYEPLLAPIRYFAGDYGFDFVQERYFEHGYEKPGFYGAVQEVCRKNDVLFMPDVSRAIDESEVSHACADAGMAPVHSISGKDWEWCPGITDMWSRIVSYIMERSKKPYVWADSYACRPGGFREYDALFDPGVSQDIRKKVIERLYGLTLPNFMSGEINGDMQLINSMRHLFPCFSEPGTLRFVSASSREIVFIRRDETRKKAYVCIINPTGDRAKGRADVDLGGLGLDLSKKFLLRDVYTGRFIEFVPGENVYPDGSIFYDLPAGGCHVFEINAPVLPRPGAEPIVKTRPGDAEKGLRFSLDAIGRPYFDFSFDSPVVNPWGFSRKEGYEVGEAGTRPRAGHPEDYFPMIEHVLRNDGNFVRDTFRNIFKIEFDPRAIARVRVHYVNEGGLKAAFLVKMNMKDKREYIFSMRATKPEIWTGDDRNSIICSKHPWRERAGDALHYVSAFGADTVVYAGDFMTGIMIFSQEYVYGPTLDDILKSGVSTEEKKFAVKSAIDAYLTALREHTIAISDPKPANICAANGLMGHWKIIDLDKIFFGPENNIQRIRTKKEYMGYLYFWLRDYMDPRDYLELEEVDISRIYKNGSSSGANSAWAVPDAGCKTVGEKEAGETPADDFLKGLADAGTLARSIVSGVISGGVQRKLCLMFDMRLGGVRAAKLRDVLDEIAALKRSPKYAEYLKDVEIEKSEASNMGGRAKEYARNGYEVFAFARQSPAADLTAVNRAANLVCIDENGFPENAYYPLAEIVAISLRQWFGLKTVIFDKELLRRLNIESVAARQGALIFSLLPGAEDFTGRERELLKKYANLKRLLIAA